MSLKREIKEIFNLPEAELITIIYEVISEGRPTYKYKLLSGNAKFNINLTIKSLLWPLISTTHLGIKIQNSDKACMVILTTTSQKRIAGDIFNVYNKYLNTFMSSIRVKTTPLTNASN